MQLVIKRLSDVRAQFGYGRSTAYARIKNGLLPPPILLGARSVGFPAHELDAVAAELIAGSGEAEIRELVKTLVAKRANLKEAVK